MLRTIIVVEHDGRESREFAMMVEVPNSDFDIRKAIQDAATDFCKTPEGLKIFVGNCGCFNWADFEAYVTNEFCERHGFKKVDITLNDITVDWDEQLVDEDALNELLEEEGAE